MLGWVPFSFRHPSLYTPEVITWPLAILTISLGSNLVTLTSSFMLSTEATSCLFAHLVIHPFLHSTESVMNLLRARHCPRCLGYDSEQNKLSPLIELSSGYKKIKQQVAQIITGATETIGSRGTVSDEVTGEQRPDGNEGCEPHGNLGKECPAASGVWGGWGWGAGDSSRREGEGEGGR